MISSQILEPSKLENLKNAFEKLLAELNSEENAPLVEVYMQKIFDFFTTVIDSSPQGENYLIEVLFAASMKPQQTPLVPRGFNETPLNIAFYFANRNVVIGLINKGVDLHQENGEGYSFFYLLLLQFNRLDAATLAESGYASLFVYFDAIYAKMGEEKFVQLLVQASSARGKELTRGVNGLSSLHFAVLYGNVNVISMLIKQKVDLFVEDGNNVSPFAFNLLKMFYAKDPSVIKKCAEIANCFLNSSISLQTLGEILDLPKPIEQNPDKRKLEIRKPRRPYKNYLEEKDINGGGKALTFSYSSVTEPSYNDEDDLISVSSELIRSVPLCR